MYSGEYENKRRKELRNLSVIEFTKVLLQYDEEFYIMYHDDHDGKDKTKFGTRNELWEFFSKLRINRLLNLCSTLPDYLIDFTKEDILEYLSYKTHGFQSDFCENLYDDIIKYYTELIRRHPERAKALNDDVWKELYEYTKKILTRHFDKNKQVKNMDEQEAKELLKTIYGPDMVNIHDYGYQDFYMLMSKENTNDLLGWFNANYKQLETNLEKKEYTWCYVIEYDTKRKVSPCIYMFFGKDISQITVREFMHESLENASKELEYTFCEDSFKTIDQTPYLSYFERMVLAASGDVFNVYSLSSKNIDDYKVTKKHIRHITDEVPARQQARSAQVVTPQEEGLPLPTVQIINNYAKGSCVFNAGSSQNGDVNLSK